MAPQIDHIRDLTIFVERPASPKGKPPVLLSLHMAYYTGMVDTVPHIPDRCLVGAGWSISGSTQVMPLNFNPDELNWRLEESADQRSRIYQARFGPGSEKVGQRIRLPRDSQDMKIRVNPYTYPGKDWKLHAAYLFIANGGHCPNAEEVRLLAFRLTDDYAYYLKVQFSTTSVQDEAEFVEACSSLLGELLPDIMRCVPDWVEVERGKYPADNPRRGTKGAEPPSVTPPAQDAKPKASSLNPPGRLVPQPNTINKESGPAPR